MSRSGGGGRCSRVKLHWQWQITRNFRHFSRSESDETGKQARDHHRTSATASHPIRHLRSTNYSSNPCSHRHPPTATQTRLWPGITASVTSSLGKLNEIRGEQQSQETP